MLCVNEMESGCREWTVRLTIHTQSVSVLNLPCWTAQLSSIHGLSMDRKCGSKGCQMIIHRLSVVLSFCSVSSFPPVSYFFPLPNLSHHFPSSLLASLLRIYPNLSSNLPTTPPLKLIYGWMIYQMLTAAEWKGFAHISVLHSAPHKCTRTHTCVQ